jgi:hypothetical protein
MIVDEEDNEFYTNDDNTPRLFVVIIKYFKILFVIIYNYYHLKNLV